MVGLVNPYWERGVAFGNDDSDETGLSPVSPPPNSFPKNDLLIDDFEFVLDAFVTTDATDGLRVSSGK